MNYQVTSSESLMFIKLGGSLITNKDIPYTVNGPILDSLSSEICEFLKKGNNRKLIIGHGSGSFGHTSATLYQTRKGVKTPEEWIGFQKVSHDARTLNHIVMKHLNKDGVPVVSFPPSAQVLCNNHNIREWDTTQVELALKNGLVPVIFGDTVFDTSIGGTILSTEELFTFLAERFKPAQILLAGIEEGVWAGYPKRDELVKKITPMNYSEIRSQLQSSASVDVTGGMVTKIENMLKLVREFPNLRIKVFSGEKKGNLSSVLSGMSLGTEICNDQKGGTHD